MRRDAQGHALTIASDEAARAYDAAIEAYLRYRTEAAARLKAALALDGEAPMLLVLRGAFAMLTYNAAALPSAQASAARALAAAGTARERLHGEALAHWAAGAPEKALAAWEAIMAAHPRDVLAYRLHHFVAFWMGRGGAMAAASDRVFPHWAPDVPGHGAMLACRCFALEEAGRYAEAEEAGKLAVDLDPADMWAAHGVAHVMEMQGRRGEGILWLDGLERHWGEGNNIRHHLFWHRALFHLERGEHARVLDLYDQGFRNLASPITAAMPDLYIDVQNAASMLFRLERLGVPVGERWEEIALKAEGRLADTLSAFTLPHWMMALGATGRLEAGRAMLGHIEAAAEGPGAHPLILRRSALPACRAIWLEAQGDAAGAVAAMRPALPFLQELGGSHAQQDVLAQFFLGAALKAGMQDDARTLLERVAGRSPVPLARRAGYAEAAGLL